MSKSESGDEIALVNEEYLGEEFDENSDHYCRKLKAENENYRQDVYDLRRKLELNETMLRETQEMNESLERSLQQVLREKQNTLREADERQRIALNEYELMVTHLESKVTEQKAENAKLLQQLNVSRKKSAESDQYSSVGTTLDSDDTDAVLKVNANTLEPRIVDLIASLKEEEEMREQAEKSIEQLQIRHDELERTFRVANERLAEKTQALDNAREELAMMHSHISSLKLETNSQSCKGNSLFAEVEDRRKNALDKMRTLHEKYKEIKRICDAKTVEIKLLKAERASTFVKWENDTIGITAENEELFSKYKRRILELEVKLESEYERNAKAGESSGCDASLGYIQTLLMTKRKEVGQLRAKVEHLTTQTLVQETSKLNLTKQLRYWRYKATSLEAQLSALKARFELKTIEVAAPFKDALPETSEDFAAMYDNPNDNDDDNQCAADHIDLPSTRIAVDCDNRRLVVKSESNLGAPSSFKEPPRFDGKGQSTENATSGAEELLAQCHASQVAKDKKRNAVPAGKTVCFSENAVKEEKYRSTNRSKKCVYPVVYIPTQPDQ